MSDTIYTTFESIAMAHPDDVAIIENNRTLTFGELADLTNTIAATFPSGVRSVGIVMNHRAEMIAAILAVLKCGAMYVPAEPDFPANRIRYMMTEAKVDFILTESENAAKLDSLPIRLTDCEICGMDTQALTPAVIQTPDSPAYVLYTSGTTGRPKGVCVTNGNVCHYVRAFAKEFHPTKPDIMLQYSVCSFDIFVEEVFGALLNGIALAIPAKEDTANIQTLMSFIERHHVTMLSGFPYLLAEMNHLPTIPASLRLLISGGDVLRSIYVTNLLAQADVYNTYGPSETTVCASYYRCNGQTPLADGTYPIGRAVQGAEICIVDQKGNALPAGETGEIAITGAGVSLGYIGDRAEENRAFERLSNGTVRYHSGDLGYVLPSGDLAFLHRKDTQIMIDGKRVEVSEVESRLYQCANVQQTIVRAFTDEDERAYMIAYIVPAHENFSVSALRQELSADLPDFMIPEFIVKMPLIPLNTNGKPDMSKLPVVLKGSRPYAH